MATKIKMVDEDKMIPGNFVQGILSRNIVLEAAKRVEVLKRNFGAVGGCTKCLARLENPHADFHLTAVIDDSKI